MAIGYICPCCGQKVTRQELAAADNAAAAQEQPLASLICQPCGDAPALDFSVHTLPADTPVVLLEAPHAFAMLTPQEKAYAYWHGVADWQGAKICLLQCSAESVPIFCLFQLAFSECHKDATLMEEWKVAAREKGLSPEEIAQALLYVAAFYGNMGNYKSFGDTKFVPALPSDRFWLFLHCRPRKVNDDMEQKMQSLWDECVSRMYSLTPRQRQIGLGASKGISTYFSANCTEQDAKIANAFLDSIGLSAYNTRLFKEKDNNKYTIRLASGCTEPYDLREQTTYEYQDCQFTITRGDYAPLMRRVAEALEKAIPHAANPTQATMLEHYVVSFTTGLHDAHKEGSRFWIQDKGPAVESYIGFIESYRDPSGVRGEWEGFVACVNKDVSRKFQVLVDQAESFLAKMPWPKDLEKDEFLRPDFTSLEVLSFGSSGVPAGINIPNYDDIRQKEGFKNVSLGNVLQASCSVAPDMKVNFITDYDQESYKALKGEAFEVQVGIHELLGHGSGKLYHRGSPDATRLVESGFINPVTGEPVTGPFYAPGASWNSTFGKLSPTYEECRAECSGLFLCLEPEVLKVFGVDMAQGDASLAGGIHDVSYINWLLMARAGLTGLEFYTPETKEWRQAHMQARYVILRLLLQAGGDGGETKLLSLKETTGEDHKPDVQVILNRDLIATVGRKTVGDFLLKLQVYKSFGDVENGSKFYNAYSDVPDDMARLREIVMARKEPRKLLIQSHMELKEDGEIELKSFPCTPEGMIQSFAARFPAEDTELMALYEADKAVMMD